MEKITVAQLKKQLKDLGEKVSGTKSVLLERLNNAQQKNATTPSVITVAGETTTIDGLRSLPLPNLTDKGTTVSAVKSPVSDQVKIVPVHESVTRKRLKTIQNEPSVMNIAGKTTVDGLKNQLRAMGAKVSGNKSVLQERVKNWQENNVTRPLFEINVIEEDKENFPTNMKSQPLENLDSKILEWLTPSVIAYYFSERLSTKGHDKGRKLFLCEFLKNISFVAKDNDVFISSVCSAETKKSTDYAVRVHLNCKERTVIKANCECPAGSGKNASCKHVGAVLYGVEYFAVTGRVKQNGACTSQLQQWHMPRQKGRQLEAITVDKLMNVPSKQYEASEAITNFFFNSIIQGKGYSVHDLNKEKFYVNVNVFMFRSV
ncbi:uncharacterized protein LOC119078358 isoform X2 [Bradysia coprophila]|uniref:uncharacterized protein LOC119078239 isoform X2 n=1 Tax=Bradysia coprophila TaxID=38358 RepID=UPI00187D8F04|nr:uncharacterized protein LOC119078239 isoform X2 [Bradysia coprophila]XP_037041758.1 uncharacterized protein LOC119078358 isoform X2 [Bradysia coprophila]